MIYCIYVRLCKESEQNSILWEDILDKEIENQIFSSSVRLKFAIDFSVCFHQDVVYSDSHICSFWFLERTLRRQS